MGMDVYGLKPTSESGDYFRANMWSWRPIHERIAYFCEKYEARYGRELIDHETLCNMGSNDGQGPDAEACGILANMFESWMEHNISGHTLDLGMRVEKATTKHGGHAFTDETDPDTTMSAHSVEDEHLKGFVEFLRTCGGFEVW